ncbi:hypothetical protein Cgig2_019748 [Carnegiea gigantea]|uniref:Uncharacterized protein n=1 Tax=Carnegiea gigantea TaxID=171969 RepID=A0A9Q1QNJ1_9CARY|nr:hypothetical protein Cgig2_019748 [Carnegiea gigantea]
MADELVVEWDKLKLTKEEEEAVEYEEKIPEGGKEEIALSVLGKFLMTNTFSVKAMKTFMQTILGTFEENACEGIRQKFVLEWTWVKAYDVPAVRQTSAFAKFSVAKVGDFVSCHKEEDMLGADKALCFRVDVKEGVTMKVDGKSIWIRFKYLKLHDFCYGCGPGSWVIPQNLARIVILIRTSVGELQYGAWLRASPLKSHRRNVETELAEERRLFTASRNRRPSHTSRIKLTFIESPLPDNNNAWGWRSTHREGGY